MHKTQFGKFLKKARKLECNWVGQLDRDMASIEYPVLFCRKTAKTWELDVSFEIESFLFTSCKIGHKSGNWVINMRLVDDACCDRDMLSLSRCLNTTLNKLFGLPADELSIFNLSLLPPLFNGTYVCLLFCDEEDDEQNSMSSLVYFELDEPLWFELCYKPCLLPIDLESWNEIPDYSLLPWNMMPNDVNRMPCPLLDFVLVECDSSIRIAEFSSFSNISLHPSTGGTYAFTMNFEKAVKLGRDVVDRSIFCVPINQNPDVVVESKSDFKDYLEATYRYLDNPSLPKPFTCMTDIWPRCFPPHSFFTIGHLPAGLHSIILLYYF